MATILGNMTAEVQALYDAEAEKHSWLKDTAMSDDEFCERLDHYLGDGFSEHLFSHRFNKHYSWVFMAQIKYFLTTGSLVNYDYDYLDSQAEYVVLQIMKADGATDDTIHSVLNGKAKYQF